MFPILVTGWGNSSRVGIGFPHLNYPSTSVSIQAAVRKYHGLAFLIDTRLTSHSSGDLPKGAQGLPGDLFRKDPTSILEGGDDHLPKGPPPLTTTLGTRFQHLNLAEGEDTSIQLM